MGVIAPCEYCGQSDGHSFLCPLTFILGDENRKVAFDMGVPVSTSDWIDAWLKASQGQSIETLRETLTELFTLHHRHVDRITERRVKHELAQTEQAIEDRVRREVEAERIKAQLEAESQQEGV